MKTLVTGGAGLIGSHIVDALLAAGHAVAVLDDLSSGSADNLPAGVPLHRVDIRDAATVARVFADRTARCRLPSGSPDVGEPLGPRAAV